MSLLIASKNKAKTVLFVYCAIFIPMWIMFIVNNVIFRDLLNNIAGIHPRDFSFLSIIDILVSWAFHGGANPANPNSHIYDHIMGNSIALAGLLLIVGLIESKPFKLLGCLIVGSGIATWVIGSSNSVHVGASGLIFAMFGYVLSSVIFGKRFIYLLPIFLMGSQYFYSLKMGLIPQEGVSFAAHFGGFVAGIIIGYLFNRYHAKENNGAYQKSLKEKLHDKLWSIKYYFKQKFN